MALRNYLKGGMLLTIGGVLGAACSFARNIIIAHLLSVEDFGIAAIFAMTMSLVEMTSNLGVDRMLIQAEDGDSERLQATAQSFQLVRGLVGTIVLFMMAGTVATLFKIPEVTWAFRLMSAVPLIRGAMHLDIFRVQRQMHFGPSVWTETVPQFFALAAAAPLAIWLDDYRVMLVISLCQVVLSTTLSHLLASRRYKLAWSPSDATRLLQFGWPLLVNGLLMFGIFHGDRAIIGATYSMTELGWFSAAFSLALLPSIVITKVISTFLLPILAKTQYSLDNFATKAVTTIQLCQIAGAAFASGLMIGGPALLDVVYGQRYSSATAVIGLLGIMQAARIAKAGPAIAAMSLGDSKNALCANLIRSLGLAFAVTVGILKLEIQWIVAVGIIAEFTAFLWSLLLLSRRTNITFGSAVKSSVAWAVALFLSWIITMSTEHFSNLNAIIVAFLYSIFSTLTLVSLFSVPRALMINLVHSTFKKTVKAGPNFPESPTLPLSGRQ